MGVGKLREQGHSRARGRRRLAGALVLRRTHRGGEGKGGGPAPRARAFPTAARPRPFPQFPARAPPPLPTPPLLRLPAGRAHAPPFPPARRDHAARRRSLAGRRPRRALIGRGRPPPPRLAQTALGALPQRAAAPLPAGGAGGGGAAGAAPAAVCAPFPPLPIPGRTAGNADRPSRAMHGSPCSDMGDAPAVSTGGVEGGKRGRWGVASANTARARARWRAGCGDRPRLGRDRYSPGEERLGWAEKGRLCQGRALRTGWCSGHLQGRGAALPQRPCGGGGRVGAALRPLLLLLLSFAPSSFWWHRPAGAAAVGRGASGGERGPARGGRRCPAVGPALCPRPCPPAPRPARSSLPTAPILRGSDPHCPHLPARPPCSQSVPHPSRQRLALPVLILPVLPHPSRPHPARASLPVPILPAARALRTSLPVPILPASRARSSRRGDVRTSARRGWPFPWQQPGNPACSARLPKEIFF